MTTDTTVIITNSGPHHAISRLFRTLLQARFLNSSLLSRHILAASTLAGLSVLGSANILITERRIFSILWTGDHRSLLDSYPDVE